MDITIDKEQEILVNNVPALPETICYENFTIDWTQRDYDTVFTSHKSFSLEAQNKAKDDIKDEKLTGEVSDDVVEDENPDEISEISEEEANASEIAETEAEPVNVITVTVNGEKVELSGKESYVFVDIFDRITFDLQSGGGRAIVTLINGRNAQFAEEIKEGDNIELYWKEN